MALESMRRAYAKDPIRELIEAREKAERDDLNRIYTARLEGKLEGRLEEKLEGKLEVARNMLAAGLDRKTVLRTTGLSEDDCPWVVKSRLSLACAASELFGPDATPSGLWASALAHATAR